MYRGGFRLLTISYLIPIPFLVLDLWPKTPDWFARSGAATLFLVAFVQFRQAARLHTEHIRNPDSRQTRFSNRKEASMTHDATPQQAARRPPTGRRSVRFMLNGETRQ